jgi:hypothetical protein
MPKLKAVLVALVVVTVAVTLLYTLTPRPLPEAARPAEATGLVMRGYSDGTTTWETTAARGELAAAAGTLSGVVLRVFDGATSTLTVSASRLAQEAGTTTLTGDVRAETHEGLTVSSEQMAWREDARRLESGPSLLTLQGNELQADALTYDAAAGRAALVGVTATRTREEILFASSDAGEISREEILLSGNVRMTSESGTDGAAFADPGFVMTADSLVLSRDGLTARGGVSIDVHLVPQGESHGA